MAAAYGSVATVDGSDGQLCHHRRHRPPRPIRRHPRSPSCSSTRSQGPRSRCAVRVGGDRQRLRQRSRQRRPVLHLLEARWRRPNRRTTRGRSRRACTALVPSSGRPARTRPPRSTRRRRGRGTAGATETNTTTGLPAVTTSVANTLGIGFINAWTSALATTRCRAGPRAPTTTRRSVGCGRRTSRRRPPMPLVGTGETEADGYVGWTIAIASPASGDATAAPRRSSLPSRSRR